MIVSRAIKVVLLCICLTSPALAQSDITPDREISNITGDLYRFRQVRHSGMFLVTAEGIIVVDPTFPHVAAWLKEELDERFGLPVKYVIYSHTHMDHAGGGEVFADTAVFIAHENTRKNLQRPADDAPLLPREQLWDVNNDGLIQESEAGGYIGVDRGEGAFAQFDTDASGSLTRAEIWAARFGGPTVRPPDIYYSEKASISLGGKTVELHYTGRNHSEGTGRDDLERVELRDRLGRDHRLLQVGSEDVRHVRRELCIAVEVRVLRELAQESAARVRQVHPVAEPARVLAMLLQVEVDRGAHVHQ